MPSRRGLRLFGHPVHPMLVHLPMGLLITAPLWDLLCFVRPSGAGTWSAVGGWTVVVGCLGGLAARGSRGVAGRWAISSPGSAKSKRSTRM